MPSKKVAHTESFLGQGPPAYTRLAAELIQGTSRFSNISIKSRKITISKPNIWNYFKVFKIIRKIFQVL